MEINPGAAEHPAPAESPRSCAKRIRRGEWNAGDRLPSIPAIAEMYGVAKQTVQRTIDQLRVEGLLITKPGSGTFVRGNPATAQTGCPAAGTAASAGTTAGPRRPVPAASSSRSAARPPHRRSPTPSACPTGTELTVRRHLVRTQDAAVEVGASWLLAPGHGRHRPGAHGGVSAARF